MRVARVHLAPLLLLAAGCDSSAAEPNYPPFVVSASPGVGDILTPGTSSARDVETTLSDDNVSDHLFIRYLIDYPSTEPTGKLLRELELPPSGSPVRAPVHIQPDCTFMALPPGVHRLLMAVSDRPFLDPTKGDAVAPEAPLDSVPDGANRIRVVWLLDCP
jgi:hypothetical protein